MQYATKRVLYQTPWECTKGTTTTKHKDIKVVYIIKIQKKCTVKHENHYDVPCFHWYQKLHWWKFISCVCASTSCPLPFGWCPTIKSMFLPVTPLVMELFWSWMRNVWSLFWNAHIQSFLALLACLLYVFFASLPYAIFTFSSRMI